MSTVSTFDRSIRSPLEGLRRRVKQFAAARGLVSTVWILLLLLVGLSLLDFLLHLPATLRLLCLVGLAGFLLWRLTAVILSPLVRPLTLDALAARVESLNPAFQDRLRSSLLFLAKEDGDSLSAAMEQQVVRQTSDMLSVAHLAQTIDRRPLWLSLRQMGLVAALVAAFAIWQPGLARIALARITQPYAPVTWPKSVQIQLAGDVPSRVPAGQRVDFAVRLAKGDVPRRQVVLGWSLGNGPALKQLMQRGDDGRYTAAIDGRLPPGTETGSMSVWVESGDDRLDVPAIELIPRLAVVDAQLSVTPPPYTKLPASDAPFKSRPVTVWAGSAVRLSLKFNKPTAADVPIVFEPVGTPQPAGWPVAQWDRSDLLRPSAAWRADQTLRFRIRAKDQSGFPNTGTEEYELVVRPDQPPAIQLESPRRSEERTIAATVPLEAFAEDDLAIRDVTLRAVVLKPEEARRDPATRPVDLAGRLMLIGEGGPAAPGVTWTSASSSAARPRQKAAYPWPLAQFPVASLKSGDVVEYYLEARDFFDLDGQVHAPAQSQHLRITLISEQDLIDRVTGELRTIAGQISEAKKAQDRLASDTEQLKRDLENKPKPDAAEQQVADRIAQQQTRLSAQASELAGRLGAAVQRLTENGVKQQPVKDSAAAAQKLLADAADGPMRDASRRIKDAVDLEKPATDRNGNLDQSHQAQRDASEQLKKAIDRLGDFGSLQQMLDRLRDLLEDQKKLAADTAQIGKNNLGKTPDQMTPADRQALDDTGKKQEELSARTAALLDQLRAAADRSSQTDPASAKAMRQAADTGQSQAVSSHQKSAAGAIRQNQQSQAQSSQKSAEMGLEMMLSNLREAERRRLEELTRKLAEITQQIEQLLARQAGHNLDNLLLQDAAKATAGATTQSVKDLLEKSHRAAESLVKPDLRQLTASQQQTHLNTVDLAKSASSLQNAEQLGEQLNKAAGRMERAMVLLRQDQVQPAYEPQTEALTALEDALVKAQEMKRQAEEQSRQQQQEEVRKVLQEIRKQQVEVADETKRLDKSLTGGEKKRGDLIRLNQVSAQQGGLAERMTKVGNDLADLGSVVFQSVAKDVKGAMQDVSGDLTKQTTGVPTQRKQTVIVRRLDAMINALKEDPPKEDRFAERSQGGSGSGQSGGRKLPPGAELKLLRELQAMLNVDTQAADAAKAEASQLTDLSQRQGAVRTMLDEMLKNAGGGKKGLPAEKVDDRLPEENTDVVDDLDAELLTGKPVGEDSEPTIEDVSRRMTRSRIRLADKDAGAITQKVQKRLVQSLDELIQKAQQQQAKGSSSSPGGGKQAKAKPSGKQPGGGKDGPGQAGKGSGQGSEAAKESVLSPGGKAPDAPLGDIRQTAREWGGISARDRQAVIDSSGEDVVEKYRKLVEDYYRSLSEKSSSERR